MTIEDDKSRPLSFTETTEQMDSASIVPEAQRYTECLALEAGAEDLVARLIEYLDDSSWRVRKAAVNAVTRLEHERDLITALIEALSSDPKNTTVSSPSSNTYFAYTGRIWYRYV